MLLLEHGAEVPLEIGATQNGMRQQWRVAGLTGDHGKRRCRGRTAVKQEDVSIQESPIGALAGQDMAAAHARGAFAGKEGEVGRNEVGMHNGQVVGVLGGGREATGGEGAERLWLRHGRRIRHELLQEESP